MQRRCSGWKTATKKQSTASICGMLLPRNSANASLTVLLASRKCRLQCISAKFIGCNRGSRDCEEAAPRWGRRTGDGKMAGCRGVGVDGGEVAPQFWSQSCIASGCSHLPLDWTWQARVCGLCRHTRSPVTRLAHRAPWLLHGADNSYVVGAFFFLLPCCKPIAVAR